MTVFRQKTQTRILLASLATLALLFAVGCASGGGGRPPVTTPQPAPIVSLTLTIVDGSSQAALMDATVACTGLEPALTDGFGRAFLSALAGQQLDCAVSRDGYHGNAASYLPGVDVAETLELFAAAPPVRPATDPWAGAFRIEDRAFVSDVGPRLPVFLHLGDIIGQGLILGVDHILPALDFAAAHGYHGVRSWFQLKITTGKWIRGPTENGWDPRDNPARFVEILKAGADRGLKWHLAAGGTRGLSEGDERQLFDLLADAIGQVGPEHFALIEGSNEARDTARDPTPAAVERSLAPVRSRFPQLLYALSAYTGHEDRAVLREWTPSWMQFYLVHGSRDGRAHDKIRHEFSLGYDGEAATVRRLGWQGEPWGPGRIVSAQGGHSEIDAHVMALGAAMAAMARQQWTVMSGPGVVYGDEPLESMPGLAETPTVIRQLPQDLMRFETIGHSGPSKRGLRIHAVRSDAPNVRADYAIANDGRYVEIVYGPPNERKDLPQERATTDDRVIHEGPWGRVVVGRLVDVGPGLAADDRRGGAFGGCTPARSAYLSPPSAAIPSQTAPADRLAECSSGAYSAAVYRRK